jgi:hypothetical protein
MDRIVQAIRRFEYTKKPEILHYPPELLYCFENAITLLITPVVGAVIPLTVSFPD